MIGLIELQLAHLDRNKSRASYDHAELLEPRRAMLQAWADMIDAALVSPRAAAIESTLALARVAPKIPSARDRPAFPLSCGCTMRTCHETTVEHPRALRLGNNP